MLGWGLNQKNLSNENINSFQRFFDENEQQMIEFEIDQWQEINELIENFDDDFDFFDDFILDRFRPWTYVSG